MLGISYRTIDSYLAQIYACTGERNERALLAAIIRKLIGQMAELKEQLEEINEN
jgi:cell division protein ZapA (FtsZ GTPase activity inhibitor)